VYLGLSASLILSIHQPCEQTFGPSLGFEVCYNYGHVDKKFAMHQLLYKEHLTSSVLSIDVNKEGFLKKKMSIAEVIAH
jgi:hypothetical protein